MAEELDSVEQETEAPELFAPESLPDNIDEQLEEAEDAVGADELVVTTEAPPDPVGRSWAFNFETQRFVLAGHQPIETRRTQTIRYWIQKCLTQPQGGNLIHPAGYGFDKPTEIFGQQFDAADQSTLQERVEDALLPHPSITAVEAFEAGQDPEDEEALLMRFHVALDDETTVRIEERVTA